MIGILCSDNMEKEYTKKLHSLFRKHGSQNEDAIIVFTISNIDFTKKTVKGSLASEDEFKRETKQLPSVIFNLALQREWKAIKRQESLTSMKGITLVNSINRFDQSMIMEMLKVSRSADKFLLPFHIYNKKARDFKPDDDKSYITMPSRGSSISRVIYTKPEPDTDRIIGSQYFKKGHICDYIDASLCQNRWIFIELPDILTHNNHPVIARAYMQKNSEGAWMVLGKSINPGSELVNEAFFKKVDEASLIAINHINKFITSLGHSFIDFIFDTDGNPYFLHLGGFDQQFLGLKLNEDCYKKFYSNLIGLAFYHGQLIKED